MSKRRHSAADLEFVGQRILSAYTKDNWVQSPPDHPSHPHSMVLYIDAMRIGVGAQVSPTAAELAAHGIQVYLRKLGIFASDHARVVQMPDRPAYIVAKNKAWTFVQDKLYGQ